MKNFKDLKKTTILGLFMSIVCMALRIYYVTKNGSTRYIYNGNLFLIGMIIYFSSVLIKIKLDKNFIKIANIILIITFGISTFYIDKNIINMSFDSIFDYGISNILNKFIRIIEAIYMSITLIFIIKIFLNKFKKFDTYIKKAFLYMSLLMFFLNVLSAILALNYVNYFSEYIDYILNALFTISIIPYFYQYNNQIINNYQEDENDDMILIEKLGLVIILIGIIGFIFWRETIYSPQDNIENIIQILSNSSETIEGTYTTQYLDKFSYELENSLKIEELREDTNGTANCLVKKNEVGGFIFIGWDKR